LPGPASRPHQIPTGMICSNDFDRWLFCGSGVATPASASDHRSKVIAVPDETTHASNYRLRTKKFSVK